MVGMLQNKLLQIQHTVVVQPTLVLQPSVYARNYLAIQNVGYVNQVALILSSLLMAFQMGLLMFARK